MVWFTEIKFSFFQPPCCSPSDTACGLSEVCKDCTTVIYTLIFCLIFWYYCNICEHENKQFMWLTIMWCFSASVTQIYIMIALLHPNLGRNFHGSLMLCLLLIVQKVDMVLTLVVWNSQVCLNRSFFCNCTQFTIRWQFSRAYFTLR